MAMRRCEYGAGAMRILLDCDGVLADFVGGLLELINRECGTSYRRDDITEFDIGKSLGWSDAMRAKVDDLVRGEPGMILGLAQEPGARVGFGILEQLAGDIYVVTSPWPGHQTWAYERTQWLWRHFAIPSNHVVHTAAKHLVMGDVLVDDKTSTLESWRREFPSGLAVQWQTPHNMRDAWYGASTRDWDELVEMCRKHMADMERNLCR